MGSNVLRALVEAARETLGTMAMADLETTGAPRPVEEVENLGAASSIALSGPGEGLLLVSFDAGAARELVASMLGLGPDELSMPDLLDGVGEIANMIAGGAKKTLAGGPHHFDLSIPTVVWKEKSLLRGPKGTPGVALDGRVGGGAVLLALWQRGLSAGVEDAGADAGDGALR